MSAIKEANELITDLFARCQTLEKENHSLKETQSKTAQEQNVAEVARAFGLDDTEVLNGMSPEELGGVRKIASMPMEMGELQKEGSASDDGSYESKKQKCREYFLSS
jgi:hypothetical protein